MIRNILIAVVVGILFAVIANIVNTYVFPDALSRTVLTAGVGAVIGIVFVLLQSQNKKN